MLILATSYFIKVLLNSKYTGDGEFYPIALWFIALCGDFVLLAGVLVVLGG